MNQEYLHVSRYNPEPSLVSWHPELEQKKVWAILPFLGHPNRSKCTEGYPRRRQYRELVGICWFFSFSLVVFFFFKKKRRLSLLWKRKINEKYVTPENNNNGNRGSDIGESALNCSSINLQTGISIEFLTKKWLQVNLGVYHLNIPWCWPRKDFHHQRCTWSHPSVKGGLDFSCMGVFSLWFRKNVYSVICHPFLSNNHFFWSIDDKITPLFVCWFLCLLTNNRGRGGVTWSWGHSPWEATFVLAYLVRRQ